MAIDFPNSPSVNEQHTAAGVTWKWDGTTWLAQGGTSSYVLPTASTTVKGGIKSGTNLTVATDTLNLNTTLTNLTSVLVAAGGSDWVSINGTGVVLSAASGLGYTPLRFNGNTVNDYVQFKNTAMTGQHTYTLPSALPASNGHVLSATTAGALSWVAQGGGTPLDTRSTFTNTTASLANAAAGNIEVTAHKSYALLKISPSIASWVTLYVDAASRTADASRAQGADPAPDSGVIAEVVTSSANQVVKMSPGVLGWHQDAGNDGVNTVFCKVVNLSGSTGTCTVSLTVVQLEA